MAASFNSPRISNNSSTVDVAILVMSVPIPLQEALKDSITSGSFVDTKFWLFSKRRSANPGRVGVPKALFVNGRVAKRVPRLGTRTTPLRCHPRFQTDPFTVLDECKSNENLRTRFPANRKPYTGDYDYEDDSDFEDDEEDVSDDESAVPPRVAAEKSGNHLSEIATIENSDAKNSESSDVISVSDLDSLFSDPPDTKDEAGPAHVGKVVVIEDVAFVT